jgi:hypothetical protein
MLFYDSFKMRLLHYEDFFSFSDMHMTHWIRFKMVVQFTFCPTCLDLTQRYSGYIYFEGERERERETRHQTPGKPEPPPPR